MRPLHCPILLLSLAAALPLQAADHLDAPGLISPGGDGRLDLADVYAFQSPDDPSLAVLIMTVNPLAGVVSPTTLATDASYDFKIDNDGDAREDITFKLSFGEPDETGVQDLLLRRIPGKKGGAVRARGQTGTPTEIEGGGRIMVGVFDDPFFFDLAAFLGTEGRSFCDGGETDFFAGTNVTAIVLEVPRTSLGADAVGVWARTERGQQVDRMGRPAINTVFIPSDFKNDFNEGKPRHDSRDFSEFLIPLEGVLLPDVLTVDFSSTDGFLNGRLPDDDVIDAELGIITGDPTASDCVDRNDLDFQGGFPYLAPAHP